MTISLGISTTSSANNAALTSGSFTPADGDLLIAFAAVSGFDDPGHNLGSFSDSQSLGWGLALVRVKDSSADALYCGVANAFAANSSMTVTFTPNGPTCTGIALTVVRVPGLSVAGISAIRQIVGNNNITSGADPQLDFGSSCLTANPVIAACANGANPAGLTPTTSGFAEIDDVGYSTPATGLEVMARDSGFAGTTLNWNTSGTFSCTIGLELDASAAIDSGPIRIHAVAPATTKAADSGQALVDFTGVAPATGGQFPAAGSGPIKIVPKAAAALTLAQVPPQSLKIRSLSPTPHISWQQGDPQLLELTALAPTIDHRAGLSPASIHLTAPDVAGTQNAGAAGIGLLDVFRALAMTAKAAASGQGLIDVTPVSAAVNKSVLHEWGRVWFAQPAAAASFAADSDPTLIELTAAPITPIHASLAPASFMVSGAPSPATAKDADDAPAAILALAAAAPAGAKAVAAEAVVLLIAAPLAVASKDADADPAIILLAMPDAATSKLAEQAAAAMALAAIAADADHGAAADLVQLSLVDVSPDTAKAAANAAAVDAAACLLAAALLDELHAAALPAALLDVQLNAPLSQHDAGDGDVGLLEFVGLAARRPYTKFPGQVVVVRPADGGAVRRPASGGLLARGGSFG